MSVLPGMMTRVHLIPWLGCFVLDIVLGMAHFIPITVVQGLFEAMRDTNKKAPRKRPRGFSQYELPDQSRVKL